MNFLFFVGSGEYALSSEEDLLRMSPESILGKKEILVGSSNLVRDIQEAYVYLFEDSLKEFNVKYPKRAISSYYQKIKDSKKISLATGVLIRFGKEEEWERLQKKLSERVKILYKNQLQRLKELLPDFYIVNATIYFEVTPCLRIVGIPYKMEEGKNLSVRVSKSNSFTKDSMKILRNHLLFQMKSDFLKLYFKEIEVTRMIQEKKKKRVNESYVQLALFSLIEENNKKGVMSC